MTGEKTDGDGDDSEMVVVWWWLWLWLHFDGLTVILTQVPVMTGDDGDGFSGHDRTCETGFAFLRPNPSLILVSYGGKFFGFFPIFSFFPSAGREDAAVRPLSSCTRTK